MINKLAIFLSLVFIFLLASFSSFYICLIAYNLEENLSKTAPGVGLVLLILSIPAALIIESFFQKSQYKVIKEEDLQEYREMKESPQYYIGKEISEAE